MPTAHELRNDRRRRPSTTPAPRGRTRSRPHARSAAVPPVSRGATPPPRPLGPDRGLGLLYWFVLATAVLVGVVLVTSAVGAMWILIPGMAVHLLMTFFVLRAIMRLMARGDGE